MADEPYMKHADDHSADHPYWLVVAVKNYCGLLYGPSDNPDQSLQVLVGSARTQGPVLIHNL